MNSIVNSKVNRKDEDDDTQVYKRPWVGLTDEDIKTMDASTTSNSSFYAGALWANAKLKEKNT